MAAITTFEYIWLSLFAVNKIQDEKFDGKPWIVSHNSNGCTRRSVLAAECNAKDEVQIVSWGKTGGLSLGFLDGIPNDGQFSTMITGAHVVTLSEHLGTCHF